MECRSAVVAAPDRVSPSAVPDRAFGNNDVATQLNGAVSGQRRQFFLDRAGPALHGGDAITNRGRGLSKPLATTHLFGGSQLHTLGARFGLDPGAG